MNLLITNHAQVLACIARDPLIRLREVAQNVGLTERAVQRLVGELEAGGFLRRVREGRRNRYEVAAEPLRKLARSLDALAEQVIPDAPLAPSTTPPMQREGIANLSFVD